MWAAVRALQPLKLEKRLGRDAVLVELLEQHGGNWATVAEEFTTARKPQLDALADMAAGHDKTLCNMAFSPARLIRLGL